MIFLKSASDFEKMRVAGAIVRDVLALMEEKCKEGVTTAELDKIAESYIRKCGAEPSFLNYNGFPYSICASVNDEVVHGFPSDRPLRDGDIVSIDVGAVINGFHGDAARTFLIRLTQEDRAISQNVTQIPQRLKMSLAGKQHEELRKCARIHGDGSQRTPTVLKDNNNNNNK